MPHLVYADWKDRSEPPRISKTPLSQWPQEKVMAKYAEHVENQYYLEFMADKGNWGERYQARKELVICDRKQTFWRRHPRWNRQIAEQTIAQTKRKWNRL